MSHPTALVLIIFILLILYYIAASHHVHFHKHHWIRLPSGAIVCRECGRYLK